MPSESTQAKDYRKDEGQEPEKKRTDNSMTRNKTVFIVLYIILCAALAALFYLEQRYPEAGSEMMRRLLSLKA